MFESIVQSTLSEDTVLACYLSSYRDKPAIFSEFVPEMVTYPYLVYRIFQAGVDNNIIDLFTLYVDIYDNELSSVNLRNAIERARFLLDNRTDFTHDRFSNIRVRLFSGGFVEEEDPREKHYNLQFSVRAVCKKWMHHITTSGG